MTAYELIRSQRRSLALELLDDGRLVVRAPLHLPEAEIARFVASRADWITAKRAQLDTAQQRWGGAPLTSAELAALKTAARDDLAARVARFAPLVGAQPTRLTIRSQRRRWGSCSSQGHLSLNALLMLAPEAVRDYVVVHELCHLLEMNHSRRFWAEVARVLPDWRASRDWLAANGHALLQRNPSS